MFPGKMFLTITIKTEQPDEKTLPHLFLSALGPGTAVNTCDPEEEAKGLYNARLQKQLKQFSSPLPLGFMMAES